MSHVQETIIVLQKMLDRARETVVALEIVVQMLSSFADKPAKPARDTSVLAKKKRKAKRDQKQEEPEATTAAKRTFGPSQERPVC